MDKKIVIATIVLGLAAGVWLLYDTGWEIKNLPPKNRTILIFGDSLAEGVGSTAGNDLSSLLATSLERPVSNHGRSGDTTRDALSRLAEAAETDPGIVIVILGGNDVLNKVPEEETFSNLEKIITAFQEHGAAVILFGVRSGLVGDGRGEKFSSVAKRTGSAYLPDILNGLFADSRYMADAIHPNDAGYARIAERVAAEILALSRE